MLRSRTRLIRNWFAWLMALVLVGSLAFWLLTRVTTPSRLRIATGQQGGLYHSEGEKIVEALARLGQQAEVVATSGSLENAALILDRDADVHAAIVQSGAAPLREMAIVTPLHREVVHVLVRRELFDATDERPTVRSVSDLAGLRVIVGMPDSGMQSSARQVLAHYNVPDDGNFQQTHFTALLDEDEEPADAAIITSGIESSDLRRVLGTGRFGLLPLDAEALAKRYRHFEPYEIPRNYWPPEPRAAITTVATSALVVVQEDSSPELVALLLEAIFDEHLPEQFATMFSPQQAQQMNPARLHPVTRRYHDPFGRYGVMHTVLESLAAGKELLFALGAAVYLAWDRWRRLNERERQAMISEQKERLDVYLDQTLEVERKQMDAVDPEQLQELLDQVTEIKLRALDKLTHEDLRGDRTFSIFLMQCANLISKIQLKLISASKPD